MSVAETSTWLELTDREWPLKRGLASSRLELLVNDRGMPEPSRSRRNGLVAAYDLTNSSPLVGLGGGHSLSWQGQGVQRFQFHGEGGQWQESGPGQTATATHVVIDGVARPDFTNVGPPIAGSYTCSASDLRMTAADPVAVTQVFKT